MTKFVLNRKTWQMEAVSPHVPNARELLQKVKRVHASRLHSLDMSDEQLLKVINQIKSGTRNIAYLITPETKSEAHKEIFYFLLRESYPS